MFPIFSNAQWRGFFLIVFLGVISFLSIAFFVGVGIGKKWAKDDIQKIQSDSIEAKHKRLQDSLFNDYLSKQNH